MLFGSPSRYANPRRGRDTSRQRVFALGVFCVLILALVSISPSLMRLFQSASPDPTMIRSPAESLEEGEHLIDITDIEGIGEWSEEITGGEASDDVFPPAPFEDKPETLAAIADKIPALDRQGVEYLFHRVRTRTGWETEGQTYHYGETIRAWEKLIREPHRHRGRELLLQGILVATEPGGVPLEIHGLPEGNPSGVQRFFTGYLHNGAKYFRIAFWKKPERTLQDRTYVRFRGYFAHLYQNEVVYKKEVRLASVPVLVGEEVELLPPRETPGVLTLLGPAAVGLLALFVVVLLVCLWIFRRGNTKYREQLKAVRKRLGTRAGRRRRPRFPSPTSTEGGAPSPDPGPGA